MLSCLYDKLNELIRVQQVLPQQVSSPAWGTSSPHEGGALSRGDTSSLRHCPGLRAWVSWQLLQETANCLEHTVSR